MDDDNYSMDFYNHLQGLSMNRLLAISKRCRELMAYEDNSMYSMILERCMELLQDGDDWAGSWVGDQGDV